MAALNFHNATTDTVDFTADPLKASGKGSVVAVTSNCGHMSARQALGDLKEVKVGPEQGVIISYEIAPKDQ